MQKYDSVLCSRLFSSSNKNKILRVTFKKKKKKKGYLVYQDVQMHDFVCLSNSAHPAAVGGW